VENALDVLAQVLVSMLGTEVWDVDGLFNRVRASWPYRKLSRRQFDLVLICWPAATPGRGSGISGRGSHLTEPTTRPRPEGSAPRPVRLRGHDPGSRHLSVRHEATALDESWMRVRLGGVPGQAFSFAPSTGRSAGSPITTSSRSGEGQDRKRYLLEGEVFDRSAIFQEIAAFMRKRSEA